MNVVRSSSDFVAEAQAILNGARWKMRTRLSPSDEKRFNKLLALATFQSQLRDAAWAQRHPRRPLPSSYRVNLLPGAGA